MEDYNRLGSICEGIRCDGMKYHRLKYRLSMEHSFDGQLKNKHHHLIEIEIVVRRISDEFMEFNDMDSILKRELDTYQYKYLNEFSEFEGDTSIEHLGEVFYYKLKTALEKQQWKLARFEISETPLRVYAIVEEEF